jgi:integrase/recombinase XerD
MIELAHNIGGTSMSTNEELLEMMKKEMELRRLGELTRKGYLVSMKMFLKLHKDADLSQMGMDEIKEFQHHLVMGKKSAANTVNRHVIGVKFFFRHVRRISGLTEFLPQVRVPRRMPTVLSEEEVAALIGGLHNVMYKAIVMLTYSAGLRSADVRNLKPSDIDSSRMVINIRNGKGAKDRQALLSPLALRALRTYWRLFRLRNPVKSEYLFMPQKIKPSYKGGPLSGTSLSYILKVGSEACGLKKKSLLTSFAIRSPSIC